MKTMKIGAMLLDEVLLEIRQPHPFTVSTYRQHMRSGAKFPPIVIDRDTGTIVSGYNRHAAYQEEYGDDYEVEIVMKSFDDEAERIAFAVKENLTHGLPMDGITRKRAMSKLVNLGWTKEQLATLFGISCKRVEQIGSEFVVVVGERKPVKAGLGCIHGKKVSAEDYRQHIEKDISMPAFSIANQLGRWLENGWVDMTDKRNPEALKKLQVTLNRVLKT